MGALKLGLNDVDNSTYHGDRHYLSSSALKLILQDKKAFYKKYFLKEQEKIGNQTALDLGTYVHALCLEPHTIQDSFAIFEGRRAGKVWEEFQETNANKIILGGMQVTQAALLKQAFDESSIATGLVRGGFVEHTLCSELDSMPIKVRADFIDPERGIIVDIKTTAKPLDYISLQKTIANLHYDLSAALYVDAFAQFYGKPFEFYFIFLGKESNSCTVAKCSIQLIHNGRLKYKKAIGIYKKSISTNDWLDEQILIMDPAHWDKGEESMTLGRAKERLADLELAIETTNKLLAFGTPGLQELYKDALKYYEKERQRIESLINNGEAA